MDPDPARQAHAFDPIGATPADLSKAVLTTDTRACSRAWIIQASVSTPKQVRHTVVEAPGPARRPEERKAGPRTISSSESSRDEASPDSQGKGHPRPIQAGRTRCGNRSRRSPRPGLPNSHYAPIPPRTRDRRNLGVAQRAGTRLNRPDEHVRKHAERRRSLGEGGPFAVVTARSLMTSRHRA